MTQEEKDLLLEDICSRIPYGVIGKFKNSDQQIYGIFHDLLEGWKVSGITLMESIYTVKPYFYPMSSMTEKQEEELKNMYYSLVNGMFYYTERIFDGIPFGKMKYFPYQIEEFFNRNHFDYRGLIPKGLAKNATNLNVY
jgi:hypothetical protein